MPGCKGHKESLVCGEAYGVCIFGTKTGEEVGYVSYNLFLAIEGDKGGDAVTISLAVVGCATCIVVADDLQVDKAKFICCCACPTSSVVNLRKGREAQRCTLVVPQVLEHMVFDVISGIVISITSVVIGRLVVVVARNRGRF